MKKILVHPNDYKEDRLSLAHLKNRPLKNCTFRPEMLRGNQ